MKDAFVPIRDAEGNITGIMDRATAERLALIRQQDPRLQDEMYREMERTSVPTWSWAMVPIPPDSAPGLACFSSGWGDGAYASYWGLRAGKVTRLVTDFELVRRYDQVSTC